MIWKGGGIVRRTRENIIATTPASRTRLCRRAAATNRETETETETDVPLRIPARALTAGKGRLRLPAAHRDTTAVLGGAYPFMIGAAETSGMFIGHDSLTGQPFHFDPWHLYERRIVSNANIAIVGNIGWGKTNTAMAIAMRGIAHGYRVVVRGDPKNDWTRLAGALGGQSIRLGPGLPDRINPLDLGDPGSEHDRESRIKAAQQRRDSLVVSLIETLAPSLAPLNPGLREILLAAVAAVSATNSTPTLGQLVDRLGDTPAANPIRAALATLVGGPLADMFDGPSTVSFSEAAPMIAIGTAGVADNDLAHTLAVLTATNALDTAAGAGRRFVIYDEAWRILASPAHLARVNSELRLSRARGTATILITHALSDSDKAADAGSSAAATARGLTALCDTRIIFRQAPGETARTATEIALTYPEREALTLLGKGEALWKIAATTRRIHTDLGATEKAMFDTDF